MRRALALTAAWMFGWGTFALVWRVSQSTAPRWLWHGAWGIAALVAVAAYLVWRQMPSAAALRALVDQRSKFGGLLMAAQEQSLGSWEGRLSRPADLRVTWRGGGTALAFAAAAVFLAACLLVPQNEVEWTQAGLEIGADVAKLKSSIELLRDERIVEPQKAEILKGKLQQIQDDSSARSPKKTFDALDQLRASLSRTAQSAAADAHKKSEALARAEKLAAALDKEKETLNPSLKKEALEELAKLVDEALRDNEAAAKGIDPELLDGLNDGDLSPEELQRLADALKDARAGIDGALERLANARLIDLDKLKPMKPGDGEPADDADAVDVAQILRRRGGQGSTTQGRSHNPITWTEGTKEDGAKFKEMALPPGAAANLKNSQKIAVGKVLPKTEEAVPSQGGAIQNSAAGGGSANTQVVLPQHRAAVQRFFSRTQ